MAKFQISDIPSATLLMDTNSIDEAFEFVGSIVDEDGIHGLDDLSISNMPEVSGTSTEFEGSEIMLFLQSLKAQDETNARSLQRIRSPERERWILRLMAWGEGRFPWTQLVVTKGAFLLSRSDLEFPGVDYEFYAHSYGPYTPVVQRDLDMLVSQKCLTIHKSANRAAQEYSLTQWGCERVARMEADVSDQQREVVERIATRVTEKHWTEMLEDLYREFPEFSVNSTFRRSE